MARNNERSSRYVQTIDLDGISVKIISLEGLSLTKQTMRDKDAPDRFIIERALAMSRSLSESDKSDQ